MTRYVKIYDDVLLGDVTYSSDGTPEGDAALASAVTKHLDALPATSASPGPGAAMATEADAL